MYMLLWGVSGTRASQQFLTRPTRHVTRTYKRSCAHSFPVSSLGVGQKGRGIAIARSGTIALPQHLLHVLLIEVGLPSPMAII
jgi:hypothetical protein